MSTQNLHVHLMGDSVLDDFYWLDNPKQDVRQQLADVFHADYDFANVNVTVNNFAVDESQIKHVTGGIVPATQYVTARSRIFKGDYDYPSYMYPINSLHNYCESHKSSTDKHYTVLSIGGNDGRIHLPKLMWGSDAVIDALKDDDFEENLESLIEQLLKINPNLILIFVYKPHISLIEQFRKQLGYGLQYIPIENVLPIANYLDNVYSEMRNIYMKLASKYKIPLIDLSKTFDETNDAHYGSTPIEPSNTSGMCIAKLIKIVIDDFNFECEHEHDNKQRVGAIYYAPKCEIDNVQAQSLK